MARRSLTISGVHLMAGALDLESMGVWRSFFRVATGFLAPGSHPAEATSGLKQPQRCLAVKRAVLPLWNRVRRVSISKFVR